MPRAPRSIAFVVCFSLLAGLWTPVYALPPKKAPSKVANPSAPASDEATITVSSLTRGAKVYLNDVEVGEVPLSAPLQVKAGQTYAIRLQKRGYAPYFDTVMAGAGQDSRVEADLVPTMGVLRIDCNVLRARVTLSGTPIGLTPFDGDVAPGTHELRVVAQGYAPETQTLQIDAGHERALAIALTPLAPAVVNDDTSILSRWWFWTAVGAVVVGGVTVGVLASQGPRHVQAGDADAHVQLP